MRAAVGLLLLVWCQPASAQDAVDAAAARFRAQLDRPIEALTTTLPNDPRHPNGPGVVRCYYYPDHTIKELDYGDHGATAISVSPTALTRHPVCGKQDDRGERLMPDGVGGFFVGAKGPLLVLGSTFGGDGLAQFFLYDARSARRLFQGVRTLVGDMTLSTDNDVLTLRYETGIQGRCSLLIDGRRCWAQFGRFELLPPQIAGTPAPVELCEEAYRANAGPVAVTRDDPSVIYYRATMTLNPGGRPVLSTGGPLRCAPAE